MLSRISACHLKGQVVAPPSKSMAHRLLIAACLSKDRCTISNIAYSEDVLATIDCLEALGAVITRKPDSVTVDGSCFLDKTGDLKCRESGSTLRFMIPLAMLTGKDIKLYGSKRLLERPLSVYENIASECGFRFEVNEEYVLVNGRLAGDRYSVRGDISSQFITGLMFALAYLNKSAEITITGTFESRSYILLTLAALKTFGFDVKLDDNAVIITHSDCIKAVDCAVEADESNAALLACYEDLEVLGRNNATVQGDRVYEDYFKKLRSGYSELDISDCPDLGPVLIAVAALNHGALFTGTRRLAIKECDRGLAMKEELEKMGASIQVRENEIEVIKSDLKPCFSPLSSHNDHRIVMALTYVLSHFGGEIEGAEAVKKSFPDYFERIKKVGAVVENI